jgi:hypothetical protein
MEIKEYKDDQKLVIEHMLDFLLARAKGLIPTGARFIRDYIRQSPLYKRDSKLSSCMLSMLIKQVIVLNSEELASAAELLDPEMLSSDCTDELEKLVK